MQKNFSDNEIFTEYTFMLIINGQLETYLDLLKDISPYKFNKKGDITSKTFGMIKEDFFCYEEKCDSESEFNNIFNNFISNLLTHKQLLFNLKDKVRDIYINIFIQSSEAKITFDFTPSNLAKLHELGLSLIHI